jgi:exosortase
MPEQQGNPATVGSAFAERGRAAAPTLAIHRWLDGWVLALAAVSACWLALFYELHGEWDINPQYDYGYVVPLLGAALLWRRWPDRPAAIQGQSGGLVWLAAGLLFLLLPMALIRQANPEWRLLYWTHGFVVLGLSFCLLYRAGGWSWVRYFAPPLLFMLIAVPWPMEWEQGIIQNLMRFVAGLTIQVAGWLGIPAVQHGNLIETAAGVVGINEACSGIRSLQSGLMLSLFLGEMNRFTAARRAILVAASLVLVLTANVGRTTFLTWAVASRGVDKMESWHDTAGLLVMIFVLPALFLLAQWMRPKVASATAPASASTRPAPAALILKPLPRWVAIGALAWVGFSEAATETWYRVHDQKLPANDRWTVTWPTQQSHFQKTTVPQESLSILRCSDSDAAAWSDDEENQWSAFFLRWDAGKNSTQLAHGHRPDICFPAAGAQLVDTYGTVTANANGLALPFKYQTFQAGDHLLHVFFCLWSDRVSVQTDPAYADHPWQGRFRAVLAGERNLGQQVLEVVVTGPESSDAAIALFQKQVPQIVHRD